MKLTSEIDGVFYSESSRAWFAKSVDKKVLYRGKNREEAEDARIEYNKIPHINRHATERQVTKYKSCFHPAWPVSVAFERRAG